MSMLSSRNSGSTTTAGAAGADDAVCDCCDVDAEASNRFCSSIEKAESKLSSGRWLRRGVKLILRGAECVRGGAPNQSTVQMTLIFVLVAIAANGKTVFFRVCIFIFDVFIPTTRTFRLMAVGLAIFLIFEKKTCREI